MSFVTSSKDLKINKTIDCEKNLTVFGLYTMSRISLLYRLVVTHLSKLWMLTFGLS